MNEDITERKEYYKKQYFKGHDIEKKNVAKLNDQLK